MYCWWSFKEKIDLKKYKKWVKILWKIISGTTQKCCITGGFQLAAEAHESQWIVWGCAWTNWVSCRSDLVFNQINIWGFMISSRQSGLVQHIMMHACYRTVRHSNLLNDSQCDQVPCGKLPLLLETVIKCWNFKDKRRIIKG